MCALRLRKKSFFIHNSILLYSITQLISTWFLYNFTLYITFIIIILFIFYKFILVYYIKEYAIIICTLFKGRSRLNSSTTHQDYFQIKNCTKFSTIWKDIKKNTCVSELKIFIKLTLVHISPFVNRMFICLIISFWVPLKKTSGSNPVFKPLWEWTRRESNPCPKYNSLSFYECSLLFNIPSATR